MCVDTVLDRAKDNGSGPVNGTLELLFTTNYEGDAYGSRGLIKLISLPSLFRTLALSQFARYCDEPNPPTKIIP